MPPRSSAAPAAPAAAETTPEPAAAGGLSSVLRDALQQQDEAVHAPLKDFSGPVELLLQQLVGKADVISEDTVATIKGVIGELDRRLSEQVNDILHHEEFQRLEGTWRGLHTLVTKSRLSADLKVRVMNLPKDDLRKTVNKFGGETWTRSPFYRKVYQEEYGMPGGQPYGALIGDYQFTHDAPDVKVLAGVAQIAAAAHAPFITAADPALLKLEGGWRDLPNLNDVKKRFSLPEYAAWRTLRKSDDARYLGLAFPRFMAREPYGARTNPVEEFAFEEDTSGARHEKFTWSNAAYAMGLNLTRAFDKYGWTCAIRGVDSGGRVEGLPCVAFPTDDGGQDLMCPTEVNITQSLEHDLSTNGLMPLSHFKNTNYAAFIAAQSLHEPTESYDRDATENAKLAARLSYLFATTRFAHFLKKMVYRAVGKNMERDDVERWLNEWIRNYVHPDPRNATDAARAERPLADARVEVKAVEGEPGKYNAKFYLRPHFQLEGMNVSLSLVAKLPASKQ